MNTIPETKLERPLLLIKKSFALYRAKMGIFISLGLISTAVGIMQLLALRLQSVPLFMLSVVASLVVSYIIYLATIRVAADPVHTTIGEALTRVEHFVVPALFVSLSMILISLGGTLLLIIPGIIVSIFGMFSVFAVVIDHYEKTDAIAFSWHIVKGKWFAVFFRLVIANIIFGLCSLAIYIVFWSLGFGETPFKIVENAKVGIHTLSLAQSALEQVVMNLISLPLTISFLSVLYENLKSLAKEGSPEDSIKIKSRIKKLAILGAVFIVLSAFISSLQLARTLPRFITITHAPAAVFTAF